VRGALLLLALGCGGAPPCSASFTGNFMKDVTGPDACPKVTAGDDAVLAAAPGGLDVELHLGAPAHAGTFSSANAQGAWHALSSHEPGCFYSAGPGAVPSGAFMLELRSTQPLHGHLELLQGVHALAGVDCGAGDVERVVLDF
jgi:hypothetical protein